MISQIGTFEWCYWCKYCNSDFWKKKWWVHQFWPELNLYWDEAHKTCAKARPKINLVRLLRYAQWSRESILSFSSGSVHREKQKQKNEWNFWSLLLGEENGGDEGRGWGWREGYCDDSEVLVLQWRPEAVVAETSKGRALWCWSLQMKIDGCQGAPSLLFPSQQTSLRSSLWLPCSAIPTLGKQSDLASCSRLGPLWFGAIAWILNYLGGFFTGNAPL